MRVGFYANPVLEPFTGIGRYTARVASLLPEAAPEMDLRLLFHGRGVERRIPEWAREHAVVRNWPKRALLSAWDKLGWPGVERLVGNVDVFHYPHFFIMPHRRAKWVSTVHDLMFRVLPDYHPPRLNSYLERCVRRCLAQADCIIADSRNTADDILKFQEPKRLEVVHLGIEQDIFVPKTEAECEPVLEEYGISRPFLLYVGRIDKRRNLIGLVRCLESIRGKGKWAGLGLAIVGAADNLSGELEEAILRSPCRDSIRLTGPVSLDRLPYFYSAAEAFVYPSRYEGFGLPPLEAAACGAPVIAGDNSSQREILSGAAVLVDPMDEAALEKAIAGILESKARRAELKQAGIELAQEFDWRQTADMTAVIYRSLA